MLTQSKHREGFSICHLCQRCLWQNSIISLHHLCAAQVHPYVSLKYHESTFPSWLCDTASEIVSQSKNQPNKAGSSRNKGLPLLISTSLHLPVKGDNRNSKSCQGLVFSWGLLNGNVEGNKSRLQGEDAKLSVMLSRGH